MRIPNILIALALIFSVQSEAADLHAIVVADTIASNISKSVEMDLKKMEAEIYKISRHANLPIQKHFIAGKEITSAEILTTIQNLSVSDDDVILFYFSGHGYRTKKKESPWPNLYITHENKGIDFDLIVSELENKCPRLMIVFADVCNNIVPDMFAPPLAARSMAMMGQRAITADAYLALFRECRGKILLAGAKTGEFAWCTLDGALFTDAWIQSIEDEAKKGPEACWESIIEQAILKIQVDQNPYFQIEIEANEKSP
ncbi:MULTISPECIES: caspase family protein [Parachlamydia]|jgi:hypothetical protein|uniref:Peptidase C14 caspase domain-containing protein n=2 Tax=Parachlamydia acanthamoebae TaxID=83552 RepID=F8KZC1_PARAV|nr:caspase family protein [Parachlamydia acanthamoebae]EFB41859.1 hypothetical protein pah_c022o158 [Parachlamydia acanthamoebae str. Hall's coccus]CCB86258.1 putative uncharacterized protein [Parachlamydia acanthamoebae UV-7]